MMRYVITVFVIALALGASASLHAWPPIGAEVQSWHYDSATNIVTLKIVNTSHKDITAFNIAIKETYADGRVEEHEMLEELVGKIILAAKESFRKQFGDGAFHPGEAWDEKLPVQPGLANYQAAIDVVTYIDGTADAANSAGLERIVDERNHQRNQNLAQARRTQTACGQRRDLYFHVVSPGGGGKEWRPAMSRYILRFSFFAVL